MGRRRTMDSMSLFVNFVGVLGILTSIVSITYSITRYGLLSEAHDEELIENLNQSK